MSVFDNDRFGTFLETTCWVLLAGAIIAGMAFLVTLEPRCKPVTDNTERKKLFFSCLSQLPKGPQSVHYNDWAEVLEECGTQARQMATTTLCRGGGMKKPRKFYVVWGMGMFPQAAVTLRRARFIAGQYNHVPNVEIIRTLETPQKKRTKGQAQ